MEEKNIKKIDEEQLEKVVGGTPIINLNTKGPELESTDEVPGKFSEDS